MLVHHDDAEREFAYDRTSPLGHLDKALDAAAAQGWKVLSMKVGLEAGFCQAVRNALIGGLTTSRTVIDAG